MEIQELNWVMRQFRWRQKISPPPQNLKELHKVDMCGKNDEDWREVHNEYIEAWDRMIDFLPIRESFFLADTTICLEYLSWFRLAGKPYLLSVEARSRQLRQKSRTHFIYRAEMGPLPPKLILRKSGFEVILLCTVTGGIYMEVSMDNRYTVMDRGIARELVNARDADTVVDAGELLGRERLFRWSKDDAPFKLTLVFVIKQPINNYNCCRVGPSLTSTFIKTSAFSLRVLMCPP
ncbi:hypothetical protein Gotri_014958, partial [Gossypium trilobum]|nr:hypothetical protein [Gossypium trilobum]